MLTSNAGPLPPRGHPERLPTSRSRDAKVTYSPEVAAAVLKVLDRLEITVNRVRDFVGEATVSEATVVDLDAARGVK